MTESEFRALLALEGNALSITVADLEDKNFPYLAMVIDTSTKQHIRYAAGKTYNQVLKAIIKAYYANH